MIQQKKLFNILGRKSHVWLCGRVSFQTTVRHDYCT
jgi:hypothetical protein